MTEQQEIITTFSEMAPRYESLMNSELNRFWGIDYKAFVSHLLEDYSPQDDEMILDIATGTAFIPTFLLENKIKFGKVVGLDITYGMLMQGKDRLSKSDYDSLFRLICASALQMPFQGLIFRSCDLLPGNPSYGCRCIVNKYPFISEDGR